MLSNSKLQGIVINSKPKDNILQKKSRRQPNLTFNRFYLIKNYRRNNRSSGHGKKSEHNLSYVRFLYKLKDLETPQCRLPAKSGNGIIKHGSSGCCTAPGCTGIFHFNKIIKCPDTTSSFHFHLRTGMLPH